MFYNCGVIHVNKNKIKEEEIFETAISAGAQDCVTLEKIFEVITEKEDFYKVKTEIEKIDTCDYSSVEWRPHNYIDLDIDQSNNVVEVLTSLEELDDVQNIFSNANLKKLKIIMKIIGIDPGLSGAIAVLENNKVLNIFDIPVMSEGKRIKDNLIVHF